MTLYAAVFVGVLIYALFQLNEVKNTPDFTWKGWFSNMWITFVLAIVSGWALVWLRDDLATIYPITPVSAFFLGVSGQAIFKKISGIFDKRIDTVVGINS